MKHTRDDLKKIFRNNAILDYNVYREDKMRDDCYIPPPQFILSLHVCVRVCVCESLNQVWLFVTSWTVAHQAPLSMEFSRQLKWVTIPFSKGSSQPRDQTQVSCIAGEFFTDWATGKPIYIYKIIY